MTTAPTTPKAEPVSDLSAEELFDSVNRYDEIAIAKAFGEDIYTLREKPFDFLRCLAFIAMRRGGINDREAREQAFGLTTKQANSYFTTPEPEIDPDDPVTAEGKDEPPF